MLSAGFFDFKFVFTFQNSIIFSFLSSCLFFVLYRFTSAVNVVWFRLLGRSRLCQPSKGQVLIRITKALF